MMGGKSCLVCTIVGVLVGIGAVNWGLVAFFQTDLVARVFGDMTVAAKTAYGAIGIAGVLKLISLVTPCPCCTGKGETKKK